MMLRFGLLRAVPKTLRVSGKERLRTWSNLDSISYANGRNRDMREFVKLISVTVLRIQSESRMTPLLRYNNCQIDQILVFA